MRRLRWFLPVLLLLAAGCSSGDGGDDAAAEEEPGRIEVSATGRTRAAPDLLTVTLGVETRAPSASAALDDNSGRAQAVLEALRTRGVADDDVQTSQVSVSPQHDRQGRITGFVVTNMVTARLHDLDAAGALLDAVAGVAGDAVRVHGLSFSIDDPAAVAEEARSDAVRRARSQAEQLAEAAGEELGRLHALRETPPDVPEPWSTRTMNYDAAAAADAVPLAAGTQEVTVHVELVYEVAQA